MNYQQYSKYSLKEIARMQRCGGNQAARPSALATAPQAGSLFATAPKPKETDSFKGMTATQYANLLTDFEPAKTSFEAAFVFTILHVIQDAHPELSPKEIVAKFEAWRIGKKKFSIDGLEEKLRHSYVSFYDSGEIYKDDKKRFAAKQWKYHKDGECKSYKEDDNFHFHSMWHCSYADYKINNLTLYYPLYAITKNTAVLGESELLAAVKVVGKPKKNRSGYNTEHVYPSFTFQEFLTVARWLDRQIDFTTAGTIGTKKFNNYFNDYIVPLVKEQTDVVI